MSDLDANFGLAMCKKGIGIQPLASSKPGSIIEVENLDEMVGYTVNTSKAWIQTASGGVFHILEPRQNEILITDIAHALGMMCRFTGHVRRFYSVAEHCVHASRIVPPQDALWALLHDSPEAYIADLNRPLKHFTAVGGVYKTVEETIMNAICTKFQLPFMQPQTVHEADTAMLYAEK
jgi:hypothetical protein